MERKDYPSDVSDAEWALVTDEEDRAQVAELAQRVQAKTGGIVEIAFVDQSLYRRKRRRR